MALKIACHKHPRYTGKLEPHVSCQECVYLYETRLKALIARLKVD